MRGPGRDPHAGQRGQVLVLFVIFLPLVFVLLSFVVDLGSAWVKKREAQNAADAGALAAAAKLPDTSAATGAANDYVKNPQKNHLPDATVDVVTPYNGNAKQVKVTVTSDAGLFFPSKVVSVKARAVAGATQPPPKMNLFAFAMNTDCLKMGIQINGAQNVFDGAIWSNGAFSVPGSQNGADELTTGCPPDTNLSNDSFPNRARGTTDEWPVPPPDLVTVGGDTPCIAGGSKASTNSPNAAWRATNPPGIYCRKDSFTFRRDDVFDGYTWVAPTITNGGGIFSAASAQPDRIIFYATGTQADAITVNGSNLQFTGGLIAPNGGIVFNGSGASAVEGYMEALQISIPGAKTNFTGTAPNPTPQDPIIPLLE